MSELHVDRLSLRVAGVSEADGRRLAELVCTGLASATPPAGASSADSLSVSVSERRGEPLELLAQRIVNEMLASFGRAL